MKKLNRALSLLIVLSISLSTVFAERVSVEEASIVANTFMNGSSLSESGVNKVPGKRKIMKAASTPAQSQYYVYQDEDGEGWVIVAADDIVQPILAYSNTGTFDVTNMPSNVRNWMGKYDKYITRLAEEGVTTGEETTAKWGKLRKGVNVVQKGNPVVGPLVTSKWDQDAPYYNLCPGTGSDKAYTGCVATAMSQVMNYWKWPAKGTGSHSYKPLDPNTGRSSKRYTSTLSADFGSTTYDWNNMLDSYNSSATDAQKTAVATLMYHCGVATEMMYGNDADGGSGTYTVNYGIWGTSEFPCAQNALYEFFGYKKATSYMRDGYTEEGTQYYTPWNDADWTAMLKEELDKNHPIMYDGAGKTSQDGGHSFICDGYDDQDYFSFNWGWSGAYDGFYLLSNVSPGAGGAGGGSYNFSYDQGVIIGIVPDKKDLPQVVVTWSVNGNEFTTVFTQEDNLVLPENPANCSDNRVFVGWTTENNVKGEAPADLFKTAKGKVVMEAVTYYAVFATVEGGSAPTEVANVTFKTAAKDGSYDYSKSDNFKDKLVDSDKGIASYSGSKVYSGMKGAKLGSSRESGSLVLTLSSTADVSKVVVNGSIYGSDSGALIASAGSTQLGNAQTIGENVEFVTASPVSTDQITIQSSKRLYISSVSIIAGGGGTYSDYGLGCTTTDIEQVESHDVKSKKILRNGQLFIIHGDKMYNATGVRIQ